MSPNWIRIGQEIAQTPGGMATIRILQAHGITHFTRIESRISAQCSVDMVIDYAHKEKPLGK